MLLSKGALIEDVTLLGETSLHLAAKQGHVNTGKHPGDSHVSIVLIVTVAVTVITIVVTILRIQSSVPCQSIPCFTTAAVTCPLVSSCLHTQMRRT
jgi:hypothetical protein